jgi:ariadne-1
MEVEVCDACDKPIPNPDCEFCSCSSMAATFDPEDDVFGEADSPAAAAADVRPTIAFTLADGRRIDEKRNLIVQDFAEQACVSVMEAECIMKCYSWSLEKTMEIWLSPDGRQTIRSRGISVPTPLKFQTMSCLNPMCDTTDCRPITPEEGVALGCGHFHCNGCFADHLKSQVKLGPGSAYTTCPGFNCSKKGCKHRPEDNCSCKELVPEVYFSRLLPLYGYKGEHSMYQKFLRDKFVSFSKSFKRCPNPECDLVMERARSEMREVTCYCGHVWCFDCLCDAHSPMPCDLARDFVSLDKSDALTEALINATTKPCPQCKVRTEKNEACIHMTCRNCRNEYCWLCRKPWRGHGGGYFACAAFNAAEASGKHAAMEDEDMAKSATVMKKYNLYKEKYNTYKKTAQRMNAKVAQIEKSKIDFDRRKHLPGIISSLTAGLRTLQWCEALAYFLKDSGAKKLFLFQQSALDEIVQSLVKVVSEPSLEKLCERELYQQCTNLSKTVENCRKQTIESIESGQLIEVLMNKADTAMASDEVICLKCSNIYKDLTAKVCAKCGACRAHGEKSCYGCNPRG